MSGYGNKLQAKIRKNPLKREKKKIDEKESLQKKVSQKIRLERYLLREESFKIK